MTSLISWIPPTTITALGWALLHFIWQGAAIAALAAGLMQCCRGPSTRYVIGVAALVLMLAAPLATFFLFDGAPGISPGISGLALSAIDSIFVAPPHVSPALPWLVEAWACGVALLGLRFAANLLLLEWHGQGSDPAPQLLALCRDVQRRLGIERAIRYLECDWLSAPAGFGALRPVILLPVRALTGLGEDQLRAVIAHELAHIRRWDFAVNLFQVTVGALLFYHPAIWWLNGRIRAEREICCDEIAVSACGNPLAYARALTLLAERKHAPAMAMAINRGLLTGRIQRLLRGEVFDPRSFVAGMAGSLLLLFVSLASGNFLLTAFPAAPVQNIAPVVAQAISGPEAIASIRQPQKEARLDKIIVRRLSRISMPAASLPPVTLTPEYPVAASAAAPTNSSIVTVADVHPAQVASAPQDSAQADDEYPAPTVAINASQSTYDWERQDASNYCDQYAQQTVVQGANRPFHVDDAAKQRYAFFYWHCMATNGQLTGGPGNPQSPAYQPVGTASAENPVNVSGSWAISFPPFAPSRGCAFTQTGNSISGTCARSEGGGAAHGVVDGRQVRWTWTYLDDEKRPVELDFIGMVGPDGTMTGASIQTPPWMGRQIQPFTARSSAPGGGGSTRTAQAALAPDLTVKTTDGLPAKSATNTSAMLTETAFSEVPPTEPKPIAETHTLPHYLPLSQRLHEQGTTRLQVALDATGKPVDVALDNSSGSPRLDDTATQYVKDNWRWEPAIRDGKPVAAKILVNVVWNLGSVPACTFQQRMLPFLRKCRA